VKTGSASTSTARPRRVITGNDLEGNRPSENDNPGNTNNRSTAPIRVFPKNETPQTNGNESPVNNNPVTRPQVNSDIRNSNNRRTFPNSTPPSVNNENPVNNNPVTRPQINSDIRNNNNRRTFPNSTPKVNNEQPANRPPAITNPGTNTRQSNPANNPVQELKNPPSANINNHSDARPSNRNFNSRIETQQPRTNSQQPQSHSLQPQGSVGQRSSEIRRFSPAQHIERSPQTTQETKK
jgi:hypothetical protein